MDLEIDEGSSSQWNQQQPHVMLQLGQVGRSLGSRPRRQECPSSRACGWLAALVAGADKRATACGRDPGAELRISSQSTSLSPMGSTGAAMDGKGQALFIQYFLFCFCYEEITMC
jgi:hypothetical protein